MNKKRRINTYIRNGIYSTENVLLKSVSSHIKDNDSKVDFDGDLIKMNSQRYEVFKYKGLSCVACGIKGEFFAKERYVENSSYHFNLYALNDIGEEVLMTKDHIIPKSKGGKDRLDNYQTMCCWCNFDKGDSYEEE